MHGRWAALGLWLGLAGGALGAPDFHALDGSARPTARIDAAITRLMAAAGVPGLALALVEDGQVVYTRAYGLADVASGRALHPDSVMYGASLTKAVFAYVVMQLAQEGVLDLDAALPRQLRRPLPDYPGFGDLRADPRWQAVTPRMLLAHTSGLLNWRWINDDQRLDFKFAPGSRYVYSGEGIQLLQLVVEERSGQPVGELIQKRVFDRFGMRDSSMVWRADFEGRAATHYGSGGEAIAHRKRGTARAAGSMDTTVADYARFMAAVLRGEGLAPATLDAMLTPQLAIVSPQQFPSHWPGQSTLNGAIGLSIGLGWPLYNSPAGPAFFKEGSDDGTNNLALGFRRPRSALVMLSNSSNASQMFYPAVEAVFGSTCLPWFWMGYLPYDRPELRRPEARSAPEIAPGCAVAPGASKP